MWRLSEFSSASLLSLQYETNPIRHSDFSPTLLITEIQVHQTYGKSLDRL